MNSDKVVASRLRGTGSFPRLAVTIDDAGPWLAPDRETSAPIRIARRKFFAPRSRNWKRAGCPSAPARAIHAKRAHKDAEAELGASPQTRLPPAELGRAGISAAAAGNLRSAAAAVCARRRQRAQPALHLDGGHAAANALRQSGGRAAGARPGRARPDDRQRHGARHRQLWRTRAHARPRTERPSACLAPEWTSSIPRKTRSFLRKSKSAAP